MWESFLITALGKNILLPPIPRACQAPARPADISAGLFPTLPLPAATRASLLRNNEGIGSPGDGSSDTGNRHWCLPSPHHADQLQISVRTHRPALAGQRSLPGPAKGRRAKIGTGTEFLLSGIEKINKNIWETRSCPHRLRTAVAERIAAAPTWFTENSGSSDGQGAAGTASHSQPESATFKVVYICLSNSALFCFSLKVSPCRGAANTRLNHVNAVDVCWRQWNGRRCDQRPEVSSGPSPVGPWGCSAARGLRSPSV